MAGPEAWIEALRSGTASREDDEGARFGHLRAEPRDSMLLFAALGRPGSTPVRVRIRNLSPGGLMADVDGGFVVGEAIEVELRGIGRVSGSVAWVAEGRIGVRLAAAIDPKRTRQMGGGSMASPLVRTSRTMWRPGLA